MLPPAQRAASPVAGVSKPFFTKAILLAIILAVVAGVTVMVFWKQANPPPKAVKEALPAELGATVAYVPPKMTVAPTPAPVVIPAAAAAVGPAPLVMPKTDPIARAQAAVTNSGSALPRPFMQSYAEPAAPAADKDGSGPGEPGHASNIVYASSKIGGIKAGLTGDQTFLLKPGILPCTTNTAIDSTFEGPVECQITMDIRPHGVTLIDRGSIIHATYKNNVQNGQRRLAVAADWLDDPATGCNIQFDNAPMSDYIGVTGIPGNVDPHYLERFGAAVMLTGFGVGTNVLESALSKGGNTYLSFGGGGGGGNGVQEVASAILRAQANIPPTVSSFQGATVAVFVNKILDFSPCYKLELKGNTRR